MDLCSRDNWKLFLLDLERFNDYRYESRIQILKLRETWNYVYSPGKHSLTEIFILLKYYFFLTPGHWSAQPVVIISNRLGVVQYLSINTQYIFYLPSYISLSCKTWID